MSDSYKVMTAERIPLDGYTRQLISAPVNPALIKQNKYDKFGDGDYIEVETVVRLLNEIFGHVWSWDIIDFKHIKNDNEEYVVCHGKLSVPGVGSRDGIGQAKADKKDNSTMFSSSASFAFKAAAKRFGIAPNLFDKNGWQAGVDVFQSRPKRAEQPVTQQPTSEPRNVEPTQERVESQPTPPPATPETDPSTMSDVDMIQHQEPPQKKLPQTAAEKGAELRDAYMIKTKGQFVAFAQIWNPQITSFEEITPEVMDKLHAYVENNPEDFEDYKAADYQ